MLNPLARSLLPAEHRALADAVAELAPGALPCNRVDPYTPDKWQRARLALDGCPRCPVLDLCRTAGQGEQYGVWGGESRDSLLPSEPRPTDTTPPQPQPKAGSARSLPTTK